MPKKLSDAVPTASTHTLSARADSAITTSLDLSEPLRAFLAEAGRTGAAQITSLDEAAHIFRQHQQAETASRVMQGWVVASVLSMGAESLRELSARADTNKSTLQELAAYFHLFQSVPDLDSVRRCAHLEFTVARSVAKWARQEQIAFCAGEEVRGVTIEQARDLTTKGFIAATKPPEVLALEEDNAKLRAQLKLQEQRRDLLARVGAALEVEGEMPAFARTPRQETFAVDEAASFLLDNLQLVYDEHLLSEVKHPEAHRYQPVIANNADAVLGKLQGRIAQMRSQIRAAYPASVDAEVDRDHQLSPHEGVLLADRCERMKYAFRQQAQKRAEDRANSQVGRRGRRVGS